MQSVITFNSKFRDNRTIYYNDVDKSYSCMLLKQLSFEPSKVFLKKFTIPNYFGLFNSKNNRITCVSSGGETKTFILGSVGGIPDFNTDYVFTFSNSSQTITLHLDQNTRLYTISSSSNFVVDFTEISLCSIFGFDKTIYSGSSSYTALFNPSSQLNYIFLCCDIVKNDENVLLSGNFKPYYIHKILTSGYAMGSYMTADYSDSEVGVYSKDLNTSDITQFDIFFMDEYGNRLPCNFCFSLELLFLE